MKSFVSVSQIKFSLAFKCQELTRLFWSMTHWRPPHCATILANCCCCLNVRLQNHHQRYYTAFIHSKTNFMTNWLTKPTIDWCCKRIPNQNIMVATAYMVRKSQMMKGLLCRSTRPYFRMAVRAVTEMDSCTKPVINQATQCTALFNPIIFITWKWQENLRHRDWVSNRATTWRNENKKSDTFMKDTWLLAQGTNNRVLTGSPLLVDVLFQLQYAGSSWPRSKPRRWPCTEASCARWQTGNCGWGHTEMHKSVRKSGRGLILMIKPSD